MEIFEIEKLDCSVKKNRVVLMKEFMRVFKLSGIPNKEEIGRISEKVERKYNRSLSIVADKSKLKIQANIRNGDAYSVFYVDSLIEAYIKECLIIRQQVLNERKAPK